MRAAGQQPACAWRLVVAITAAGDKGTLAGGLATLPGDLRQLGGCVNILAQPGNREAAIVHYPVLLDTVAAASVADAA